MNAADEIEKLHSLKERGIISQEEFEARKSEIFRGTAASPPPQQTPAAPSAQKPTDNRSPLRKWGVRIIVAWFCIALLVMCITGGRGLKRTDPAELAAPTHHVGDAVKTSRYEIKVIQSGTTSVVGNEFLNEKAGQGATFVVVVWTLKNISERGISGTSLPTDVYLYDASGQRYSRDFGATMAFTAANDQIDSKLVSDLNPGVSTTEADVFEVGSANYDPNTWKVVIEADKDVVFGLGVKKATSVDVENTKPAEIATSRAAPVSKYGHLAGKTTYDVLNTEDVRVGFEGVMGSRFSDLESRLDVSSPTALHDGWIFGDGLMQRQGGSNEAAIAIHEHTGRSFAAMLIDGERLEFFGTEQASELPPPLLAWIKQQRDQLNQAAQ